MIHSQQLHNVRQASVELASIPFDAATVCEICGSVVGYADALRQKTNSRSVCGSYDCHQLCNQKSTMIPSLYRARVQFLRTRIRERRENEAAHKKIIEAKRAFEKKQEHDIYHAVFRKTTKANQRNTHLVVIPSGCNNVSSLAHERFNQYSGYLREIIREASGNVDSIESTTDINIRVAQNLKKNEARYRQNPGLRIVSDQLCSMCKGGCCVAGGDQAYLTIATIRRVMSQRPDLSPNGIQKLYLSYLNSETIDGSCINNTKEGCAIPRELRSEICNAYYCDGIKRYHEKVEHRVDLGVVMAIKRAATCWSRADPEVNNQIVDVALLEKKQGPSRLPEKIETILIKNGIANRIIKKTVRRKTERRMKKTVGSGRVNFGRCLG